MPFDVSRLSLGIGLLGRLVGGRACVLCCVLRVEKLVR